MSKLAVKIGFKDKYPPASVRETAQEMTRLGVHREHRWNIPSRAPT